MGRQNGVCVRPRAFPPKRRNGVTLVSITCPRLRDTKHPHSRRDNTLKAAIWKHAMGTFHRPQLLLCVLLLVPEIMTSSSAQLMRHGSRNGNGDDPNQGADMASRQSGLPLCKPDDATLRHKSKIIRIGVILDDSTTLPWGMPITKPAIEYARETIYRTSNFLDNYTIELDFRDSQCSETTAPLEAIDMYIKKSADVFLGPACVYAIAPVARFASSWGIPVVSGGAIVNAMMRNRELYKLLTNSLGSYNKAGDFVATLMERFHFEHVGMMYHDAEDEKNGKSNCWFAMESLFFSVKKRLNQEFNLDSVEQFNQYNRSTNFGARLRALSKTCRVIVLCANPQSVREIMIKARELNFDNGEYVFFNIDLFASKNAAEYPWKNATDTPKRNEMARKAYEALMTVTLRKPTNKDYKEFSEKVKARAEFLYKNFTYGEDEVNSFVGAFHDAVILYAIALNESLAANVSITNGSEITRRMWNRTFPGITGNVSIDENGDRNADYSLLDMNPGTGAFRVVANYYGNKKEYVPVPGEPIYWAGGRDSPPPDKPSCGFDGSKCPPDKPFPIYAIIIIILAVGIVVIVIVAIWLHRSRPRSRVVKFSRTWHPVPRTL